MTVLSDTQLETYKENGFLIIDSEIEEYKLDAIVSLLEPVWESQQLPGTTLVTKNRIQDAWRVSEEILSLSQHQRILFEGVKCWRPGLGNKSKHYFEPLWINQENTYTQLKNNYFKRVKNKLKRMLT